MISYNKATEILKKNKIYIEDEIILSKDSIGRVSSRNIKSPNNYPAANNTAFDGFAINSKESNNINTHIGKKFKIIKVLAAGDNPKIKKVPKFSCIEVMTGAIIQKPFDTVIPIENIKYFPNKHKPVYIVVNKRIKKNNNIRFSGSDYKKGETVITKGQIIQPNHILAFKTLGIEKVLVKRKPKIVFYSTGNEITNNIKIPNWKVRNSNNHYLKSFLESFPIEFKEKKILRDNDNKKFKKEIKNNLALDIDMVVSSGAVSAGKFDFVPKIIKQFKLKKHFKGVRIRPGKPIMFARFKKKMVFFGLPGNPISSAACFRFFILPFLYLSLGARVDTPIIAKIKSTFVKKKNYTRFIKGRLLFSNKGRAEFKIFKGQESYKINPFSKSNSWGFFPHGKTIFKKGTFIKCYSSTGINELFIK